MGFAIRQSIGFKDGGDFVVKSPYKLLSLIPVGKNPAYPTLLGSEFSGEF
jgi:hypothetical protein